MIWQDAAVRHPLVCVRRLTGCLAANHESGKDLSATIDPSAQFVGCPERGDEDLGRGDLAGAGVDEGTVLPESSTKSFSPALWTWRIERLRLCANARYSMQKLVYL